MCKMREIFAHTVRNEAYKTHMSRKLYHTDKKTLECTVFESYLLRYYKCLY